MLSSSWGSSNSSSNCYNIFPELSSSSIISFFSSLISWDRFFLSMVISSRSWFIRTIPESSLVFFSSPRSLNYSASKVAVCSVTGAEPLLALKRTSALFSSLALSCIIILTSSPSSFFSSETGSLLFSSSTSTASFPSYAGITSPSRSGSSLINLSKWILKNIENSANLLSIESSISRPISLSI